MKLRSNGYYRSVAFPQEDWHAGIHMKYNIFNAYTFITPDRILIASIKTKHEEINYLFVISDFSETADINFLKEEENRFTIYSENGNIYIGFKFISDKKIIDDLGHTYSFIPWPDQEEE